MFELDQPFSTDYFPLQELDDILLLAGKQAFADDLGVDTDQLSTLATSEEILEKAEHFAGTLTWTKATKITSKLSEKGLQPDLDATSP